MMRFNSRSIRILISGLLLALVMIAASIGAQALAAARRAPLITLQQYAALRGADLLMSAGTTTSTYLPWVIK